MTRTLDSLLADALAQSASAHAHLARPALRATVARRRVVRKATVSAAASVGVVGLGLGAFAVTSTLTREPAPRNPGTVSLSPTPTGEASPSASAGSPSSTSLPSVSPVAPTAWPSFDADGVGPDSPGSDPLAEDAAPAVGSLLAVCQESPLIAAHAAATGGTASEFGPITRGGTVNGCSAPRHFFVLYFERYDVSDPASRSEYCADDQGTPFTYAGDPAEGGSRGLFACLDGIMVVTYEVPAEDAFVLSNEDFFRLSTESILLAPRAAPFIPVP